MKEFRIVLGNRPGELARLAESLSRHGVNIKAVCSTTAANQVTVHMIGHDIEAMRSGLDAARVQFIEQEVFQLIIEDKAGELAQVAQQLGDAGINIDAIYLSGKDDDMIELVLAVDDVKKAKKILNA